MIRPDLFTRYSSLLGWEYPCFLPISMNAYGVISLIRLLRWRVENIGKSEASQGVERRES